MKKNMALVMATMMAAASLTACGGSGTASTTAADTKAADTTAAESKADETTAAADTSDKTWVIATDTAFKPFEYTDESGNFVGIDMDILKAIAEDQGFKYDVLIETVQAGAERGVAVRRLGESPLVIKADVCVV